MKYEKLLAAVLFLISVALILLDVVGISHDVVREQELLRMIDAGECVAELENIHYSPWNVRWVCRNGEVWP